MPLYAKLPRRVVMVLQAIPPFIAVFVIAAYFVLAHNEAVARDRQNQRSVITACNATYAGGTDLVTAIGTLIVQPGPHHAEAVSAVNSLQAAVDSDYKKCLAGTKGS